MSFMLVIKNKGANSLRYSFTFSQLCLYSAKEIFFNYQVFKTEPCQWVGEFRVGGLVGRWLVDLIKPVKDKITNIFKTNTNKNYNKPTCVSNVYRGGKKQK